MSLVFSVERTEIGLVGAPVPVTVIIKFGRLEEDVNVNVGLVQLILMELYVIADTGATTVEAVGGGNRVIILVDTSLLNLLL